MKLSIFLLANLSLAQEDDPAVTFDRNGIHRFKIYKENRKIIIPKRQERLEEGFTGDFSPFESLGIDERGKSPFGKVLKV